MLESERRALHGWASERQDMLRLSREERDHIATHALDELVQLGLDLHHGARNSLGCSDVARKIAALSNLLGDIGWEREAAQDGGTGMPVPSWFLGELFPVAQLRPWLEEWQRQDNEALIEAERALEVFSLEKPRGFGHQEFFEDEANEKKKLRQAIADAQTKLGTGAILLARIEKWMASNAN
jgi:hypothetical protein